MFRFVHVDFLVFFNGEEADFFCPSQIVYGIGVEVDAAERTTSGGSSG
jgi:hypothetical protein